MQKMLHPSLVVSVIFAFVLAACGRESVNKPKMSEDQAFAKLSDIPMDNSRGAVGKNGVSAEALTAMLQDLIDSGKIKLPKRKGASAVTSTGTADLSALTNILSLITSGQANNIFSLASGLVSQAGGNGTQVKFDLDFIISLLNTALPIIMTVAPQFAVIVQALVVILPMVSMIINLFKKPKTTPTPTPSPAA